MQRFADPPTLNPATILKNVPSNAKQITPVYHFRDVKVVFPLTDVDVPPPSQGDTFANAIWPVMAVAQCFGLMPVSGIRPRVEKGTTMTATSSTSPTTSSSPSAPVANDEQRQQLVFRWKTLRVFCCLSYLAVSGSVALLFFRHILIPGITARNMVGLVFFSFCCFCGILFLLLALRWPRLMSVWALKEAVFLQPPYFDVNSGSWRLATKIRVAAGTVLAMALLEHMLFYASNFYNYFHDIGECNWTVAEQWHVWMERNYAHIFSVMPSNIWIVIVVLIGNSMFTFAWNYMDVFIMMISLGLAERFKQINQRLASYGGKPLDAMSPLTTMRPDVWLEIRQHYVLLCELLETVDVNLAPIILLSSANNLYFICFQLLNIFNSLPYLINNIYFWYSLLYLIGRTVFVFLCAASVHDASLRPLEYMRHAQTAGWCTELERFGDQIGAELIALSGMKFFYLTRKLLFGMAGTIVTYELVMMQIDASTKKSLDAGDSVVGAVTTVASVVNEVCQFDFGH